MCGSGLVLVTSCKKDESKVYFNGGSAPALTSTAVDSISLPLSDTTGTAVTFNWTNPNYTFTDGISSLNVTYYLQFDTLGGNFSSPVLQTVGISSSLSQTYTVSSLNNLLSNVMGLATGVVHNVQVRVEAFIQPYTANSPKIAATYSDTLNFTVNPYTLPPVVAPPSTGTLYITGSATADGWMVAGNPASIAGQQLTQVTPTMYSITMPLIGGQQFLLVPANNWNNKYATTDANSPTTGDTFAYNAGNNFNGPATSGTYTVTFNFQAGTYTIK